MKYIITKDNIILKVISSAKEDFAEKYNISMFVEDNDGNKFYLSKEDLKGSKQADTIEELCDVFVVVSATDNHIEREIYNNFDNELFTNLKCKASGFENYGAIWTTGEHDEPILKSVAKMNEKGKLELL